MSDQVSRRTVLSRSTVAQIAAPQIGIERVERAAILHDDHVYSIPRPGRHHNICHAMHELGMPIEAQRVQGFTTSRGRFVDREEGVVIARAAGQIIRKTGPERLLFSEDMW